jgi:hypothetical protein
MEVADGIGKNVVTHEKEFVDPTMPLVLYRVDDAVRLDPLQIRSHFTGTKRPSRGWAFSSPVLTAIPLAESRLAVPVSERSSSDGGVYWSLSHTWNAVLSSHYYGLFWEYD